MSNKPTSSSTRQTSDRRRHDESTTTSSTSKYPTLNPRRIQTGLPGIRRTVYDGALRVNSDAYDVLSCAVRDVFDNTFSADGSGADNNGGNMNVTNISLQAKPEWRKHFPLNALLRPSINSLTNDQLQQKKQRRSNTLLVTELSNATVVTHHPRIVNEATGERAMCAVESVVTKARNLEV
eukprot:CAMPEP_0201694922 /NCGR_PEP_ID=MMETSP0578-20130828/7028_1 /ASSEMBLY_ACC=CAM_ASM_000663 /TAXON_ID=267565 /ORGANISM="Skeletonema grethea, Strain CCMP 1804" /LENGTH=179 /DNA_ID=CAMNT_0048180675 /DNA_START=1 /DNA_END=536 /DNA_ORIENTATION=+